MIGGDNWHVEETYATMRLARRLIGEVLAEKIAAGCFGLDDAQRLAGRILKENAVAERGDKRSGRGQLPARALISSFPSLMAMDSILRRVAMLLASL